MASSDKRLAHLSGVYRQEKWIPGKTAKSSIHGKSSDDPSQDLQVLRQFDLNWEYGPCINITRLERWDRAYKLGLHPPKVIREAIFKSSGGIKITLNVCGASMLVLSK